MENKQQFHEPVLVREIIEFVNAPLNSQAQVIDATLGTGGHSLELCNQGYRVLGLEADLSMLEVAEKRLADACPALKEIERPQLVHGNFKDVDEIARQNGFDRVWAVIFDLGVSNLQLMGEERGFSFANPEAPLDMRIDPSQQGLTGADLLNALREDQLTVLFGRVLNHFQAKELAREVLKFRAHDRIATVRDFVSISKVVRPKAHLDPATLPFLALRIAVNSELENIAISLPKAFNLLIPGGRLLVISFHSLEEEEIKTFFAKMVGAKFGKVITKVPVMAKPDEVNKNAKSRSAKLHVIEKI